MRKSLLTAATAAMVAFASASHAQSNPAGTLLVNEISNGTNSNKEFVELLVGSTDTTQSTAMVDVSHWIIDDNNGIFSNGVTASGLGISKGHFRLSSDSLWKNLNAGTLVVLFNGRDYDTTLFATNFNQAVANAATTGYYADANGSIYVAAGLSKLVEANYVSPDFSTANYCGATYAQDTTWDPIALRNACSGDGIQTRCPGCTDIAGEPTFYHGISYGTAMAAVTGTFLNGAHINLPDTSKCGTGGDIYLDNAASLADAGNGAFWKIDTASVATPGAANTSANQDFINNIAGLSIVLGRCVNTPIVVTPPDTTSKTGKGVLMVTEASNGPAGTCEYVEMLVANGGGERMDSVDVSGWIIDDNSGNFNVSGCVSGVGISKGHYRLAFDGFWNKIPVGSIIVVYNVGDNCYTLPTTFTFDALNNTYYIPVSNTGTASSGTAHLEYYNGLPDVGNCVYCSGASTYTTAANWGNSVGLNNSTDAMQVRCPGCNSMYAGAPTFYHGIGYGPATGTTAYATIAATANSLGGAVVTGSGTGSKFEFVGSAVADLGNPTFWTKSTADAAGSVPASVGSVSATFRNAVITHALTFPACGSGSTARTTNNASVNNLANEAKGIFVYPNPATQTLFVEFPATDNSTTVKILDLSGRTVAQQVANGVTKVEFNVSNVAPGFYVYQVISNNTISSGKVLINK